MLSVEKVYDELYGMIEDLKRKIAAISGGDDVTITPALESGTKVADYSIGEDTGSLYAPTPFSFAISSTPQKIGTMGGKDCYIVSVSDDIVTGVDKTLLYENADADHMEVVTAYIHDTAASDPATDTVVPYYVNNDVRCILYSGPDIRYYCAGTVFDTIHAIILFTVPNETRSKKKK